MCARFTIASIEKTLKTLYTRHMIFLKQMPFLFRTRKNSTLSVRHTRRTRWEQKKQIYYPLSSSAAQWSSLVREAKIKWRCTKIHFTLCQLIITDEFNALSMHSLPEWNGNNANWLSCLHTFNFIRVIVVSLKIFKLELISTISHCALCMRATRTFGMVYVLMCLKIRKTKYLCLLNKHHHLSVPVKHTYTQTYIHLCLLCCVLGNVHLINFMYVSISLICRRIQDTPYTVNRMLMFMCLSLRWVCIRMKLNKKLSINQFILLLG